MPFDLQADRGEPLETSPGANNTRVLNVFDTNGGGGGGGAQNPTIYSLDLPTADTEVAQALADATKMLTVRARNAGALRLAFVLNGTNTSWLSIPAGASYSESNLNLSGTTLYVQSNVDAQTVEILQWT